MSMPLCITPWRSPKREEITPCLIGHSKCTGGAGWGDSRLVLLDSPRLDAPVDAGVVLRCEHPNRPNIATNAAVSSRRSQVSALLPATSPPRLLISVVYRPLAPALSNLSPPGIVRRRVRTELYLKVSVKTASLLAEFRQPLLSRQRGLKRNSLSSPVRRQAARENFEKSQPTGKAVKIIGDFRTSSGRTE